jgi:hypothetical protein
MIDMMQSTGSIVMVESPDGYDEYWLFPLVVSSLHRGYSPGTKLDWRSSLIHRQPHLTEDEFLREP